MFPTVGLNGARYETRIRSASAADVVAGVTVD
jgi:hypothetical protein